MLLELSFLNGSKIGESFCISAYKCLRGPLIQRRTGLRTVQTGLRTRHSFAYEVWRFPFDGAFGLVDSHRHIVRYRDNAVIWITFTNLIFYQRCRRLFVKLEVCWPPLSSQYKESPYFLHKTKECFRPSSVLTQMPLGQNHYCLPYSSAWFI